MNTYIALLVNTVCGHVPIRTEMHSAVSIYFPVGE